MSDSKSSDGKSASFYSKAEEKGARAFYDDWASDYDSETASLGLRLPGFIAAYVARFVPKGTGPILDAAAGTGQVGSFLRGLGYGPIHGNDISEAMLALASRSGDYVDLRQQVLGEPLDYGDHEFSATVLSGALGPGHAPPDCLRELARVTRPGGVIVFNVVVATWEDQGISSLLRAMQEEQVWDPLDESPDWDVYSSPRESVLTRVLCYRTR